MGGISSRYNNADTDEVNMTKNAIDIPLLDASSNLPGPITLPIGNTTQAATELQRIVNNEKQYHMVSNKEMNTNLNLLLQNIQLNILANNYNEKNIVILNKLLNELTEKKHELKDSKEANYADYRRIELIQKEIKEKNRTIILVIISSIILIILSVISFLILRNNQK